LLALEQLVGELRVPGSEREVAERVPEAIEGLLRVVAALGQLSFPLVTERLGHDVLDREVGAIEVDVNLGPQVGLKALQHEALLVCATM
jgi:hypothetical protein